jgi:centrosomal CEP192-like protein
MRFHVERWGWIVVFAAGCAEVGSQEESTSSNQSALTQQGGGVGTAKAPAAAAGATRAYRSHANPADRQHPTGLLEVTPEQRKLLQAATPKLTQVRPTKLALDRIKQRVAEQKTGGQAPRSASADLSALEGQLADTGTDLVTAAPGEKTMVKVAALATLPRSVDNSALPAFPEIRDQGGIGSCVGFAVGYYLYTHELGLIGGWNNKTTSNTNKVSPKWAYNLSGHGENNGTSASTVHGVLAESGALMWSDFPYNGDVSNPINFREWPRTSTLWKKALSYKSLGYSYLNAPTDSDGLAQIKSVLLNGHVVNFATHIYSWQFDVIDNDPSTSADDAWVGQNIATWQNGQEGAHEATIVGYNDDIWVDLNANGQVDSGEKGAFKIANSWGNGWQNNGYAWVAYDAAQFTSQVPLGPASDTRAQLIEDVTTLIGARINYQPNLLAEVTLSTADRGNFSISLGVTEPDRSGLVLDQWFPTAISSGGPYAFDGTSTTVPQTGSFVFDLSSWAPSYGDLRYEVVANNWGHFTSTVSGVALVDRLRSNLRTASTEPTAVMGEGQSKTQGLRYKFQDPSKVPQLTVSPASSIAFGNLALGAKLDKTLNLTNSGNADLMITSLRYSNPLFLTPDYSGYGFRLAPGETRTLNVEFAPASSQSETSTLNIRNTSSNLASPSLSLTGSGTSNDDRAPIQVFITQQNGVNDNSVALRAEVKNRSTSAIKLSNYRVVYYLNDPEQNPASWVWDTTYTSAGPITAKAKKMLATKKVGARRADTALTFTFTSTNVAAGSSAIFQGTLHRADYSWYPDETDDWSRYLRRDGMAEGTSVQLVSNNSVVFGVGGELQPGGRQFRLSPTTVTSTVTSTFIMDASDGYERTYRFYNPSGALVKSIWTYMSTPGQQTETLELSDLPAGTYTVILELGGSAADLTTITKI